MRAEDVTEEALLGGAPLSFPKWDESWRVDLKNAMQYVRDAQAYMKQQRRLIEALRAKLPVCGEDELTKAFQDAADDHTSDGEVEVDDGAVVSFSEEMGEHVTGYRGAYVQAWVFIRMDELSEELQREHGARLHCPDCQGEFLLSECNEYAKDCRTRHGGCDPLEEVSDGT